MFGKKNKPLKRPGISVVMSVYNGEKYLQQSIDSIINQSFSDYEFIIINDGSIDNTQQILEECAKKDSRVKIINHNNVGLTKSLNIGIKNAASNLIARQDADDISLINRLTLQYDLMQSSIDTVLCGSNGINRYEPLGREVSIPSKISNDNIHEKLFFKNPFAHTSVMFRKCIFNEVGGYDEKFVRSQDFELWMRMSARGRLHYFDEPLVVRRVHDGMVTRNFNMEQFKCTLKARMMNYHKNYFMLIKYTALDLLMMSTPRVVKELVKKFITKL
jgi:glycosyltransferase involved in cell wall biosynthesis